MNIANVIQFEIIKSSNEKIFGSYRTRNSLKVLSKVATQVWNQGWRSVTFKIENEIKD